MRNIKITGARTHNLKNISLEIPSEKITVISGISGSGKSSLAFDTIFAEGQRRFMENLSSYARQVIGVTERPDVDSIEGIPPAISIDQKSIARSPRSTVGTLTEAYDYLRLIFARFGRIYCPNCQKEIFTADESRSLRGAREFIEREHRGNDEIKVIAPIARGVKGSQRELLARFAKSGYRQFRIDGDWYSAADISALKLEPKGKHTLEAVVLCFKPPKEVALWDERDWRNLAAKLEDAFRRAFELSEGFLTLMVGGESRGFSRQPTCEECSLVFPPVQPRLFSFNSPHGACPRCQGLGVVKEVDRERVIPNKKLTIMEGAIRPWARLFGQNGQIMRSLDSVAKEKGFDLNEPVEQLRSETMEIVFSGADDFEGIIPNLNRRYRETDSDYLRQEIEQYMTEVVCSECEGKRLNRYAGSVKVWDKTISELSAMETNHLAKYARLNIAKLLPEARQVVDELIKRLDNLKIVGLEYLTLDRSSETLSGGEAQRIRLGTQFDAFLSGVLYVLDEPTISLHAADTEKLVRSLRRLNQEGNTLVVVEHDREIIRSADFVFDIGPGAGKDGGRVVAQGTPGEIAANPDSLTGAYLSGKKQVVRDRGKGRRATGELKIVGARHNNLKDINVSVPLGLLVVISGPSGSGKSSLVYDVLSKAISAKLHGFRGTPGAHERIEGMENLDKIIRIDQMPIGRTPRSNLATYTGLFTPIREIFANCPKARLKGYQASRFSFNLKGGRCESCRGDGSIKVEMFFMGDIYVVCEECGGQRYNSETLEVKYKGKTIADVLKMSVDEVADFFSSNDDVRAKVRILQKVGLGYLPIGQSATTLSGGEAQRIKLATELSRPSTGKTIYILDEPTTGLHFEDIKQLLRVLGELVERGNTVLVIEHNLDVIKSADWVIDLGPGGGEEGGELVAQGSPAAIARSDRSLTGKFLGPTP